MLIVPGKQHSFSTHERMFLWKCHSFWHRKCLELRGTRPPNLRIHAECPNHSSYRVVFFRLGTVFCYHLSLSSQIARFMGSTWGPPGSCRPQMGPMMAPWTLLSGIHYTMRNMHTGLTLLCFGVFVTVRPGQSYDFPSDSETTLQNVGKWISWIH